MDGLDLQKGSPLGLPFVLARRITGGEAANSRFLAGARLSPRVRVRSGDALSF